MYRLEILTLFAVENIFDILYRVDVMIRFSVKSYLYYSIALPRHLEIIRTYYLSVPIIQHKHFW